MNLINEVEINRLLKWAEENEDKNVFIRNEDEREGTFWKSYERENTYIMEYDYETLPEFEKLCGDVFENNFMEIQRVVSVATFKNSPKCRVTLKEEEKLPKDLPEYIYTF